MRPSRKLAIALGAVVLLVVLSLLALPMLFRGRIETALRREVNASVRARVGWDGIGLSLLRDFPNATLSLDGLTVVGIDTFSRDTLLTMRQARLVLNLGSVLRQVRGGGAIVVREVALVHPVARLRVLADGRANWDITRPAPAGDTTSSAMRISLRDLRITDGQITMDDAHSRLSASVMGLDESLRGDFARERVVLATHTRADSVSVRFAGVPYLTRVGLELNAEVNADLPARRFTFRNDSLRLNHLVLAFAGTVTAGSPNLALDVTFAAPGTAFRDILSLVPAVYAHDFDQVQASGTMAAMGSVRGAYGPHAFPALMLRAKVDNGSFRYPSLPLPARDIFMDLAVDNPGGHVDSTVINLRRLHATIGGRQAEVRLVMRTPVSDPDVDFRTSGSVDLGDVARTVRLDSVSQLAGVVAADVAMHARVSDVNARRYDRIAASGTMNASRIALRAAAVKYPVAIDTMALHLTPRAAELTAFTSRVGASDATATGTLDNLLGFVLHDDVLRGQAAVSSTRINLDEWKSDTASTAVIPVPPLVDFTLNAAAARVTYGALDLAHVRGTVRVKDQRVTLDGLHLQALRGTVVANGFYETTTPKRPTFDMSLALAGIDIPSAFASLATVRALAPVARWAQGALSGSVSLRGPLGGDMTPVFTALAGQGAVVADGLSLHGASVLDKLASTLSLAALRDPSLGTVHASFDVSDGRVHVQPFTATMNGVGVTVAGSNGIDQSLLYDLTVNVPRSLLSGAAGGVVARLASEGGKAGADTSASGVKVGAHVTGTVTAPVVRASLGDLAGSAATAVRAEATARVAAVKQRADSAIDDATRRARAEAARALAQADSQAAVIRAQARTLADAARRTANERADSLLARATNPMARLAAKAATDRVRGDADQQAQRIIGAADARADSLVSAARRRAGGAAAPAARP